MFFNRLGDQLTQGPDPEKSEPFVPYLTEPHPGSVGVVGAQLLDEKYEAGHALCQPVLGPA